MLYTVQVYSILCMYIFGGSDSARFAIFEIGFIAADQLYLFFNSQNSVSFPILIHSIGWSDLSLFPIFENLHISVDQVKPSLGAQFQKIRNFGQVRARQVFMF